MTARKMTARQTETIKRMAAGEKVEANGYCFPGWDLRVIRSLVRKGLVAHCWASTERFILTDAGRSLATEPASSEVSK